MSDTWDDTLAFPEPVTEDSVARAFAERHADMLLYCGERGGWHVYDGAVWRRDRMGVALQRAREVARELSAPPHEGIVTEREAAGHPRTQTVRFVAGVERFARGDPAFAATADMFDADPFVLGTPDGPVDLRSGRRLAPEPGQFLTRATAVGPAESADCPLWRRFLDETFGDPDLVRFLQQYLGTALTGDTREQVLVVGHGSGGNGKSVLARTIAGLMGDYAVTAAPGILTAAPSPADRHASEIARLDGARFVTLAETDGAAAWDAARVKRLTDGDPITVRRLHREAFTFMPRFKLFVTGTAPPTLARIDEAMRRRLCLLPFARRPAAPDPALTEKLKAEWPAILRWMIEGCLDWQAHGLIRPPQLEAATDACPSTQDRLGRFLDEACECAPGDAARTVPAGALFDAWSAYARSASEAPGSKKGFADALQARGFARGRNFAGRHFSGLRLRSAAEPSMTA